MPLPTWYFGCFLCQREKITAVVRVNPSIYLSAIKPIPSGDERMTRMFPIGSANTGRRLSPLSDFSRSPFSFQTRVSCGYSAKRSDPCQMHVHWKTLVDHPIGDLNSFPNPGNAHYIPSVVLCMSTDVQLHSPLTQRLWQQSCS